MTMSHRTLTAVAACRLTLLAAATASKAATATFQASFEAERHAAWEQPRAVDVIDCHGQHYYAADGDDNATIKTRRPFAFSAGPREIAWSASFAQSPRERFDFYNCPLTVPEGMHVGSFPMLPAKVNRAKLFGRSRRPVVITATKDYGPTSTPLSNLGVSRTASGRVTWKLKLIRTR
jgi:hypothetical protein